ncbi:MAG: hypothetical protein R3E08_00775 [Thiotrichaceae bacterium]
MVTVLSKPKLVLKPLSLPPGNSGIWCDGDVGDQFLDSPPRSPPSSQKHYHWAIRSNW